MFSICTLTGDFFAAAFLFAGFFGFFVTFPVSTFFGAAFAFGAFLVFVFAGARIGMF